MSRGENTTLSAPSSSASNCFGGQLVSVNARLLSEACAATARRALGGRAPADEYSESDL
jgi:hypothetical protein